MAFIGTTGAAEFSGLTWTGRQKNTDKFDSIIGIVFSDFAGNLNVDHSLDGVNWDVTDTVAVPASTGTKINVTLMSAFVRARFVATATQPTVFRCGLKLGASGDS